MAQKGYLEKLRDELSNNLEKKYPNKTTGKINIKESTREINAKTIVALEELEIISSNIKESKSDKRRILEIYLTQIDDDSPKPILEISSNTLKNFLNGSSSEIENKHLYSLYLGYVGWYHFEDVADGKRSKNFYKEVEIEEKDIHVPEINVPTQQKNTDDTEKKSQDTFTDSKKKNSFFEVLKYTLPTILVFGLVWIAYTTKKENISDDKAENSEKIPFDELGGVFKSKDSKTFKLLILPFKRDKNCDKKEGERTNYPSLIIDRYNELIRKNDFNFEIQYVTKIDSTFTPQDIANILNCSDIDLVLWGRYDEDCKQNTPLVSLYHAPLISMAFNTEIGRSINFRDDFFGSTGLKRIHNTGKIRKGFLLEKVDEVVFFGLGNSLLKQKRYDDIEHLSDVFFKGDEKKPIVDMLNAEAAYVEGNFILSEKYFKEIISNTLFNSTYKNLSNSLFYEKYFQHREKIIEDDLMILSWVLMCFSIMSQDSPDPYMYKILYRLDKDTPKGYLDLNWIQDEYDFLVGTVFSCKFDDWGNVSTNTKHSYDPPYRWNIKEGTQNPVLCKKVITIKYKGKEVYQDITYPNKEIKSAPFD